MKYEVVRGHGQSPEASRILAAAADLHWWFMGYREGFSRRALIDEGIPLSRLAWVGHPWTYGDTLYDGDRPLARVWVEAREYVLTAHAEWLA